MPERPRDWRWKVTPRESNSRLSLRYEPGNWGDVLKGTWSILLARHLAEAFVREERRPFRYRDPFAGAPSYPLLPSVRSRMEWIGSSVFVRAQEEWLRRGELASTASLVVDAVRETGIPIATNVFDQDVRFRQSWLDAGASFLDVESGEKALAGQRDDLLLIDPYDLFDRWEDFREGVRKAASHAAVLLYLYNKSPRGGGYARRYETLRREFEGIAHTSMVGRIPSDVLLPRAYHEVILLAPPREWGVLEGQLRRATQKLTCRMATSGAFEGPSKNYDHP